MRIVSSKSGVTRTVVIALVAIIIVGGIVGAYIALRSSTPHSSSATLSHAVSWQEMASYTTDYWNVTETQPYTVMLNDSMTVSSGDQWLLISALNGGSTDWSVTFLNSTAYQIGGNSTVFSCVNGSVNVVVNSNSKTFTGATSNTVPATFTSLTQIRTVNGDGDFNSGNLKITLTTS